jgi:hypothetical protein
MTRDVLGVVLAERLEFVSRRAGQVASRDLVGDLRSALALILRRSCRAAVFTVKSPWSAGTRSAVAGRPAVAGPTTLATGRTITRRTAVTECGPVTGGTTIPRGSAIAEGGTIAGGPVA